MNNGRGNRSESRRWIPSRRTSAAEAGFLGLILAVTVFLRAYHLSSLPLGLRYDEAFNGIDILAVFRGEHPIFFAGNYGREPLFIYLQAFSVALLGQTTFALRAVAAAFGILTVLASFTLGCRLFSRRVGLLTAAWLSISLWHVIFSRIGLRTISLPVFGCATVYCLWRGLESVNFKAAHPTADFPRILRPALPWFAASGFALGLSMYTYTAARLLPVVLAAFAFYLARAAPNLCRRSLLGFTLAAAIAVVVFAPEAAFFVRHPQTFVSRIGEVSILNSNINGGDVVGTLARTAGRTLGMFNVAGDDNWDRNIPGRPIFDPASSLLMGLGLVLAVARWRQPAYGLLLIWLTFMIAPGFLAARDAPNFLHFTGLIPAVFVLPALGAEWLWNRWDGVVNRPWQSVAPAVLLVAFIVGALLTYRDYFTTWSRSPEVAFLFDSDRWLALDLARQLAARSDGLLFVGAGDPGDPLERYALEGQPESQRIRVFDGTKTLPLPSPGASGSYLFSVRDLPPSELREQFLGLASTDVVGRTPAGGSITRRVIPAIRTPVMPGRPLLAHFESSLDVLGFDLPAEVRAGERFTVRWYWRIVHPDPRDLTFFNQLLDERGQRRAQADARAFAPNYWPAGSSGVSWFDVVVDRNVPTGPLTLSVGVYDRDTMTRLTITDPNGRTAGRALNLGPIKVHGMVSPEPTVDNKRLVHFADQIDLVGYGIKPIEPTEGGPVTLTLDWEARGRPSRDYTVFVHLLDDKGGIIAQGDAPPRGDHYPSSLWDAGEVIEDPHLIQGSAIESAGSYRFAIGLYNPTTGLRLATLDDNGKALGDTVVLNWAASP